MSDTYCLTRLFGNRKGRVYFHPTPEQKERIVEEKKIILQMGRPEEGVTQLVTGLIFPEQIREYFCEECDRVFEGSPTIEVYIDRPKDIQVGHLCPQRHFVVIDFLEKADGIPEEFIGFDATGEYKRPTPKAIEDLFEQIKSSAEEGSIDDRRIEILERWAGKIGYQVNREGLAQARQIAEQVQLRKFEKGLPKLVEEILERDYGFSLIDQGECTNFEGTGIQEYMEYLLTNLPKVPLPKDTQVREKLERIFRLNTKMYFDEKQRLEREREEFLRKSENRIGSLERAVMQAKTEEQRFLERMNHSQE